MLCRLEYRGYGSNIKTIALILKIKQRHCCLHEQYNEPYCRNMKKTYVLLLSVVFLLSCSTQRNVRIVNKFIKAYNSKDDAKTLGLLHQDFAELWERDTVIQSKTQYAQHYAWGKVMNDREEIKVLKQGSKNQVATLSTYYCDRDRLLGITPYKSKRVYEIRRGKIRKIVGGKFHGYDRYDQPRREQYKVFFKWLLKNYDLYPADLPFDKKGAEQLKEILLEYKKRNK